jgi:drug/metabolite transporter (DMT)-like permease
MKWTLVAIVVVTTVLSDLLMSHEMKLRGEQTVDATGIFRLLLLAVSRRYLLLAIFLMAVSFFAFMSLVQKTPLSFAVPASAASIVLETLLAKIVLREAVGMNRTAGALLVLSGVLLLSR